MRRLITFRGFKNILLCWLLSGFFITSCKSTGQGIKKDYKHNKEKVGEKVEETGENMQDNN